MRARFPTKQINGKLISDVNYRSNPLPNPRRGDVYLDKGNNTHSGMPGYRWFNGKRWIDLVGITHKIFAQSSEPSASEAREGDIWVDTDLI